MQYLSFMAGACVPLPAPGGPIRIMRIDSAVEGLLFLMPSCVSRSCTLPSNFVINSLRPATSASVMGAMLAVPVVWIERRL
jgi:hypothetical protein